MKTGASLSSKTHFVTKWLPALDLQDAAILLGAAAVVGGVAVFSLGIALVVAGLLLIAGGILWNTPRR